MNPLYSPYGAYELKAVYQRNGLKSTICVAGMVCLLGLILTLYDRIPDESVVIIPPNPRIFISTEIPSSPSIVKSEQSLPKAATQVPVKDGIPIPVPDEVVSALELTKQTEMSGLLNSSLDGSNGNENGAFGVIGDSGGEYIAPSPDVFVPVEQEAIAIYECKPEYPRLARQAGLEGIVFLFVLVSNDGTVKEVRINKTSGIEALDLSAMEYAYKNIYRPAIQNGLAIDYWMGYRVVFELE